MKKTLVSATASAFCVLWVATASAQTIISANITASQTLASGTLTVNPGVAINVSTGKNAVAVQGTAEIDNYGTIEQTGTGLDNGRAIRDTKGTGIVVTLRNYPGALIFSAADDAIQLGNNDPSNGGVLYNQGTVQAQGSSDQAVNFNHVTTASSTVYNYAGGVIASQMADAVRPGAGGSGFASSVYNAGIVCISSSAGDTSSSDGVDLQSNAGVAVYNGPFSAFSDTPSDTTTASASVPSACPATVTGAAIIQGERHGITGGNTNDGQGGTASTNGTFTLGVTNAAGYTIQGDNGAGINIDGFGVNASGVYTGDATQDTTSNEVVTIVNDGTITGNGVTRDGDGVDVDGLVAITNNGTIRSLHAYDDASEGITVGGGTIVNNAGASIEGDNSATNADGTANTGTGRGITLAGVDHEANTGAPIAPAEGIYADTTVSNSGTIRGQSDAGIAVTGAGNAHIVTITNAVGGVIEGAGNTYAAIFTGANAAAVTNYGTIAEDTAGLPAIDLGSGDSSLAILGGSATVEGDITGGTGTSTLRIVPGAGNTFSYAGAISNFASAEIGAGTTVLSGANTYTGSTTIDTGGTLRLDGGLAGAVVANGTLLGKGTVGGAVEIADGATIHPGDVAGDVATLTTGALTLAAGATANFDLSGGQPGVSSTIQVEGQLDIGNGANLVIAPPASPGVYTLFAATSVGGSFGAPTFSPALPSTWSASVTYSGTAVLLTIGTNGAGTRSAARTSAAPLSSAWLLGLLGALLAASGFVRVARRA